VPDTLDLAERTELAINAVAGTADPTRDYKGFFLVRLDRHPPVMSLAGHNPKSWQAMPLLRLVTGSSLNLEAEKRWRELMLDPQMWSSAASPLPNPLGVGGPRALAAIAIYSVLDKDNSPAWRELGNATVDRWASAAAYKDDYAYYGEAWDGKTPAWVGTYYGWLLQALSQYYQATGYQPALTFASKLAHYLKDRAGVFDQQGRFLAQELNTPPGYKYKHFHHHTNSVMALAEYALATGKREFAEFARKGYEFARAVGNPVVGFSPEYITSGSDPPYRGFECTEGCCVADMIALQVKLTKAGVGDYWDDLDRTLRNQFAAMQMLEGDWMYRVTEGLPAPEPKPDATSEKVPERNVGVFGGWALPNDMWAGPNKSLFQHCCLPNCARALYYAWESILCYKDGLLRLNLLLNRASPWADVDSHIPYQGRLDVKIKQPCRLEVRLPEWTSAEVTSCEVNRRARPLSFAGRYAKVGRLKRDDLVSVTFPISERTIKETIGGLPYTLTIKGNTVVSIDPPGRYYPFYVRDRAHYRQELTRWKKVTRFVASEVLEW
jgi:hypothetical protein